MNNVIFLTGLPRSGTKLLRDLMNNHSRISIPNIETVLIPYLTNMYGLDFDLNNRENFLQVCSSFKQSTFYHSYKRINIDMAIETLYDQLKPITWTTLFEEILKYYGPKKYNHSILVGDKTPGYIDHTDLLLTLWPNAKIIHIIRDARDYVCSVNKVWSKNIFRAANRWNNTMVQLNEKNNLNEDNYLAVYYESLLTNPQVVMVKICQFLKIDFEDAMLVLKRPAEKFGDAKGHTSILSSNKNKYKGILTRNEIYKIEQIAYNGLKINGYKLDNSEIIAKNISKVRMLAYKLFDGLNALIFHIRLRGIRKGAYVFFQLHKENI